ncbi:MAG: transcriptional repressor [Balneolales bacterium]
MGFRVTKPRQAIWKVLSNTIGHLSAEEIYLKVYKKYPKIGLTTVYRNLEIMEKMGLVKKYYFGDGRHRYELLQNPLKPNYHHHLVCTGCRRVIDFDDFDNEEINLLKKVEKVLSQKHNFEIAGHLIQFYGFCKSCN